jgi:hypothetical protein
MRLLAVDANRDGDPRLASERLYEAIRAERIAQELDERRDVAA